MKPGFIHKQTSGSKAKHGDDRTTYYNGLMIGRVYLIERSGQDEKWSWFVNAESGQSKGEALTLASALRTIKHRYRPV